MPVDLFAALEHHQRGDLARAAALYHLALTEEPDNPDALNLMGVVRLQQGDAAQAAELLGRAAALRPEDPTIHVNLGEAFRALGQFDRTIECCRTALAIDPGQAEVHGNLALAYVRTGDLESAVTHFRTAVHLKPNIASLHHDLGNTLLSLGHLEEAKASFLEARKLLPQRTDTHAALAHVWEQLGEFEQAITSLRETLERNPDHAWALGRLATRMGRALAPSDQAAIEGLLAGSRIGNDARCELLFGLAHVHDKRGEFAAAARLSSQANSLQSQGFRARGRVYDHVAHRRFVDRAIAEFTPHLFERLRGFGLETERPVFIVGLPRSGTSLTEQILASHPRVFGAGELTLARTIFETLPGAIAQGGFPFDAIQSLDRTSVHDLATHYDRELTAINASADRIVDKMPDNTAYLGLISTIFPHAKLIHCRRDLRDIGLSCWMTNFMHVSWACDPDWIAYRIAEHERLMSHWHAVLPIPVLEINYESTVADLEGSARALVDFCGLDWNASCLEFHKTQRAVRTSSVAQVRQPLYSSSVGRWRNYERLLPQLFEKIPAP